MRFRSRRLRRVVFACSIVVVGVIAAMLVDGWRAFGRRAEGWRRSRMERSRQFDDGSFRNPEPLYNDVWGMLTGMFAASDYARPDRPVEVFRSTRSQLASPPATGLRVTWFGHSSLLIEIDGRRILTDPVWGPRASPYTWVGPKRFYPPLVPLKTLLPLDAVLVSHDHYDHLDYPTIVAMRGFDTRFIVPLGVGAHLEYWGVPKSRIVELDWWEAKHVGDLEIVCTPARHASGRTLLDKDATLWAGYALRGPRHRAYFSGDTGLFPRMRDIGRRLGPFDVTMIEVGAYNRAWPDWHLGPEQAVRAHRMVKGQVMVPIHWGMFDLAFHGWTEPVERTIAEARRLGVPLATPRPGESVEPQAELPSKRFWPDLPWRTAAQDPISATRMHR